MSATAWIASYPKSGNTWVRALLHTLESGELGELNQLGIGQANEGMDPRLGVSLSDVDDLEAMRLLRLGWSLGRAEHGGYVRRKTHQAWLSSVDEYSDRWQPAGARAVYVVRDPRAVAVSWAHHLGCAPADAVAFMSEDHHEMKPAYLAHGGFRSSTWSMHVRSWTEQRDIPVLCVRYEELIATPVDSLAAIAQFLGIPANLERLVAAVEACSFDALATREILEGFVEAASVDRVFFRRGEAEAWRDELDPRLARRVEEDHAATMRAFGYLP
jgi:aryl sulfotransferase